MSQVFRRNGDVLREAPPSEWLPNLRGREDVPRVIVDAITRLHEDNQRLYQQLQEAKTTWANVPITASPLPVPNTFNELNIGSPASGSSGAVRIRVGLGDPENVVQGTKFKDVWFRTDGTAGNFCYLKETGDDSKAGWVAKF